MLVQALAEKIKDHGARREPVRIQGGNSKAFYGRDLSKLEAVSTLGLNQIISYEPSELVIRVQAGCSIAEINSVLAEKGQMLGFEPPDFGGSTIGGAIASGIAGSRRPYAGAGRDFLLGLDLIDGTGEVFTFGGQVMKNVAGYDVSRLMAGALGCLGVITEVSLKVLPQPECEQSAVKPVAQDDILREMNRLSIMPEVSALAWRQGQLHVRFGGSESTVKLRLLDFNGTDAPPGFWQDLDSLAFFPDPERVWRVSTQAMDQNNMLHEADVVDWGGAQRWIVDTDQIVVNDPAYKTLVKTSKPELERFSLLSAPVAALHRKLKATFDPLGILNPNKLYEGI